MVGFDDDPDRVHYTEPDDDDTEPFLAESCDEPEDDFDGSDDEWDEE